MSAIDLQDGFDHEPTSVRVNGSEVFRGKSVTTALLTGVAQHIRLAEIEGPAVVEISLEKLGSDQRIEIAEEGTFFLGIFIQDGKVKYRTSKKPFGYA